MKGSLLCSFLAYLALAGAAQPAPCTDKSCPVEGPSLLQSRDLRSQHRKVGLTEFEESETREEQASWEGGARTQVYSGAKIIMHKDADLVDGGKRFRWVITLPNCTNDELKNLTANLPTGSKLKFTGNPDKGGICEFIMDGTEDEIKKDGMLRSVLRQKHFPAMCCEAV
mmetsp:Transcript_78635/g.244012  ORF Transcript_78635/g.244012 Transcript_78635/m.244012 type:complete len:169 (+) Transcript_78635:120-626(+)